MKSCCSFGRGFSYSVSKPNAVTADGSFLSDLYGPTVIEEILFLNTFLLLIVCVKKSSTWYESLWGVSIL